MAVILGNSFAKKAEGWQMMTEMVFMIMIVTIKASEMLAAPRILECFGLL